MKKIVYTLCIAMLSFTSVAQNSISGTVKSDKDASPMAGVIVYLPDLKIGGVSKEDGSFKIERLPKGTFVIEARLIGFATTTQTIKVEGDVKLDFTMMESNVEMHEVVVTGNAVGIDNQHTPMAVTEVSHSYINENSSTNVIDAIANTPGVSAMTDGQSISKPTIRGLGYNRVLTINDGVEQMDQAWFDEFGIEADPDAVDRYEILKGPASLAYGSDAIAGVINLIPEKPMPEGEIKGDVLMNYQTNNGLINNMIHIAGNEKGIAWSARVDNIMAHAYQDPYDGYVLNSQFQNYNADGTVGIHRKWGYSQLHASYFDMQTGIVDGTRDSLTGKMERQVAYPDLNGGAASYEIPTNQEFRSYTPFCINQHIRHTKFVWDNSLAVGRGHISAIFSYQKNQRQETNDPTIPNTPDIYYYSEAYTFDVRYVSPEMHGFNYSIGGNGAMQISQSLGTLMLIPNYNFLQDGAFLIANEHIGKLYLSGGVRFDQRTFHGVDHWVDSTTQAPAAPNAPNAFHEFQGFTSNFSGLSWSLGATYDFAKVMYVKLNVAQGYRAPNVAECAANGVHDGTVVYELGDNTIKPETSLEEDFTFGINSKNITLELNVFNNSITNFIYAQGLQNWNKTGDSINNSLNAAGLGAAPVYKYVNGNAQLYGGEAMLDIHPVAAHWIELIASYSMVNGGLTGAGVVDSVKYLPFVPPNKTTADIKFHIRKIGNRIKAAYVKFGMINCEQQSNIYEQTAIYTGLNTAQTPYEYAASRAATKGYTLFNAGIGGDIYNNGHKVFQLFIACNNLMNTAYMDYMSRFKYYPVNYTTDRVGVFNMGRNISFKLVIPFDVKTKS